MLRTHSAHSLLFVLISLLLIACSSPPSCTEYGVQLNEMNDSQSWDNESETVELCRQALEQCPDLAIANEVLGWMALENGNVGGAKDHLLLALNQDPENERLLEWVQSEPKLTDGYLLLINDHHEVEKISLKGATVGHYAQLSNGGRLLLCDRFMGNADANFKGRRIVDQYGKQIGVSKYEREVTSPEKLDEKLMEKALYDPDTELGKAVFLAVSEGVSLVTEIDKDAL